MTYNKPDFDSEWKQMCDSIEKQAQIECKLERKTGHFRPDVDVNETEIT